MHEITIVDTSSLFYLYRVGLFELFIERSYSVIKNQMPQLPRSVAQIEEWNGRPRYPIPHPVGSVIACLKIGTSWSGSHSFLRSSRTSQTSEFLCPHRIALSIRGNRVRPNESILRFALFGSALSILRLP